MKFSKEHFMENLKRKVKEEFVKDLSDTTPRELFECVSYAVMDYMLDEWIDSQRKYLDKKTKQAYYFSAEFLMGRALGNNIINMCINKEICEILRELGFNYNEIEDQELDAGLGNGGLGRLAACFLDSASTLNLPLHGYGIRYKYGIFEQKIIDGYQMELPDNWLKYGDPWSIRKDAETVVVNFGGNIILEKDDNGKEIYRTINTEDMLAIPYDMPIIGYKTDTVNTLRLWEAKSYETFNLQLFNDQQYLKAVEKENIAEDISRVLYPNDTGPSGKALRLRQQYFFVSASLQDLVKKYEKIYGNDFSKFPEKINIQLNDTHPAVAIPELMRILIDCKGLNWDAAWDIVVKTFSYTNHTIMAEALEKWPIDLFSSLLPRIYRIIEDINMRLLVTLKQKFVGDWDKYHKMAIIADGMIKMSWLAVVGSHSVNGVAKIHTEILKNKILKEWYELYPEKFNSKTNGVTQRRWLLKSNENLADFITKRIGEGWIKDLYQLKNLENYLTDEESINKLYEVKQKNKIKLAEYIKGTLNIEVNTESIFDVQVKRLHEYKRQLLNVLYIMHLRNKIKENPNLDIHPITFIFAAKAASGYRRAKLIIKLINDVASVINNDNEVNTKIKVIFLEDYKVSLAERIFPAADISEQISTAGTEASGTGNMKFMLNGALTLGTLDGSNIEIAEEVGTDNIFIFGLTVEEVEKYVENNSYNPFEEYNNNKDLRAVVDQLVDGTYNKDKEIFKELYNSLLCGVEGNRADQYFVLKDFNAYVNIKDQIQREFRDKKNWTIKSLKNIANAGRFSSDRVIKEYASEIWHITEN